MKLIDSLLTLLLPTLILIHLLVAPYTKVEESFNIQAAHDVLVYGTPTADVHRKLTGSYDHFTFPGAVPRSFIGAVLLAGTAQPLVVLVGFEHAQLIVRGLLGLFNAAALALFTRNLGRAFGKPTARWYVLLQAAQFHVIFYASRTLPNMFAFGLTTIASAFLLPSPNPKAVVPRHRLALSCLVFATAIFRSELAILLAMQALYLLIIPLSSVNRLVPPVCVSLVVSLAISVPIDSYFWQRPLWPELWGFYYNAVLGASSNWGTSPWHYYFTSALPRLLLNPLVPLLLIPTALTQPATTRTARHLVLPNLLFIAVYSLQPHKEARFIIYTIPPLTAAAALGAAHWSRRASRSPHARLPALLTALSIPAALAAATAMLLVSSLNYPGGDALTALHALVRADPDAAAGLVPAHAAVLACMTGVTLFGAAAAPGSALPTHHVARARVVGMAEPAAPARGAGGGGGVLALDRSEDAAEMGRPGFWGRFDYVLVEEAGEVVGGGRWVEVGVVEGYGGVEVLRPGDRAVGDAEGEGGEGKVVGRGRVVREVRAWVRAKTGGWWVGPRMVPRLRILKRVKKTEERAARAVSS